MDSQGPGMDHRNWRQPLTEVTLTNQALWLSFARMFSFGFNLIFPLVLVRVLDRGEFGLYRQAFLVVVTFQTMLSLGMAPAAAYFLPREPQRGPQIIFNITSFHLVMGSGIWALLWLKPALLSWLFHSPEMEKHAGLIGLLVLLTLFSSFLEFVTTAMREIRLSSVMIASALVVKGALMLAAAVFSPRLDSLLEAVVLQTSLHSAILIWYLQSRFPGFWKAFHWGFLKEQLWYSVPLGLSTLCYYFFEDLHHYFVSHSYDPATYAIYAVGCLQIPLIGVVRESIGQIVIIQTSQLQGEGKHQEVKDLTLQVARKLSAMYWGFYGFFLVCGRDFLLLLYTNKYAASWPVLLWYLTLLPLNIFMYDPIFRAYSNQRFYILRLRLVLLAILALLLTPAIGQFGMLGAVGTVVLIHAAERALVLHRAAHIIGFTRADLPAIRDVWRFGAGRGRSGVSDGVMAMAPGVPLAGGEFRNGGLDLLVDVRNDCLAVGCHWRERAGHDPQSLGECQTLD